jgi:Holliday junction resolvasome RuvABC endonuclease subunit
MKQIILKIKDIEFKLGKKIKRYITSLGLDCASKSGWAIVITNSEYIEINTGFINVDVKGIKDKYIRNNLRYNAVYKCLKGLIKKEYDVIVENVYYGRNANTLILLSRIGAIAWTLAKEKGCKIIKWFSAVQARSKLGLPTNKKKPIVHAAFTDMTGLKLSNNDIVDAVILALVGVLDETN